MQVGVTYGGGSQHRRLRSGFTLVELLTVIAIIAVLTAILFPVFASARKQAQQGGCITNLKSIIQGMKMYKDDWGVYPDALFGVSVAGGPFQQRLFPDYVKSSTVFTCPLSAAKQTAQTVLVPQLVQPTNPMTNAPVTDLYNRPLGLASFSTYDFGLRPNAAATGRSELHYRLKWTVGAGSIADEPRQLYYRNPPDSTVVSWCLYHSDMNLLGDPPKDRLAVVGFLGGQVQTRPAEYVANWPVTGTPNFPFQVQPK